MFHTLRSGVTPARSRLVCLRSERRFRVIIWFRCVGQFPFLRDCQLSLVLRPFSLWMGFEPSSEASLRALSRRVCFLVVLAEDESLRLSLALSPVFFPVPCYGYMSASTTLAPGLRLSLVPYPRSFQMGWSLCRRLLLVPFSRRCILSWWSSLWLRFFGS